MSSNLNFNQIPEASVDAYWLNWLLLAQCIFGFFTNLVNMTVFANQRRFKEIRYKFLLVKSTTNWLYFTLSILSSFFTYCTSCPSSKTYFAVNYSIYVTLYICSCLGAMRMFLLLGLSVSTFMIMATKSAPSKPTFIRSLIAMCVISVGAYLYLPFGYQIIQIPGTGYYRYKYNNFGDSRNFKIITIVVVVLFVLISIIVFILLNLINFIKLKLWLYRKRKAVREVNTQNAVFEAS
jgi:hypothetical protein